MKTQSLKFIVTSTTESRKQNILRSPNTQYQNEMFYGAPSKRVLLAIEASKNSRVSRSWVKS